MIVAKIVGLCFFEPDLYVYTFDVDACIRAWCYRCFGGLRHMMRRFRSGNTCCDLRVQRERHTVACCYYYYH